MQTTIDRLYEWVDFKGDSIYKLSKVIEVSNGYFSKQKQSNGAISSNIIEKIVSYYTDLDANWFLTGKGEKIKRNVKDSYDNGSTKKSTNFSTETKHKEKLVLSLNEPSTHYGIPLIPIDAMAGFGTGGVQVMDYDTQKYIVPEFTELKVDFMIRVKGSSMYPKYNSGDLVACKKLVLSDIFFQWNKVYVLDTDQGALIKRIKKGSDNHLLIVSDNPSYEPYELHLSKIHAIAIVLGVIRLE
jgi:repressor LexA